MVKCEAIVFNNSLSLSLKMCDFCLSIPSNVISNFTFSLKSPNHLHSMYTTCYNIVTFHIQYIHMHIHMLAYFCLYFILVSVNIFSSRQRNHLFYVTTILYNFSWLCTVSVIHHVKHPLPVMIVEYHNKQRYSKKNNKIVRSRICYEQHPP